MESMNRGRSFDKSFEKKYLSRSRTPSAERGGITSLVKIETLESKMHKIAEKSLSTSNSAIEENEIKNIVTKMKKYSVDKASSLLKETIDAVEDIWNDCRSIASDGNNGGDRIQRYNELAKTSEALYHSLVELDTCEDDSIVSKYRDINSLMMSKDHHTPHNVIMGLQHAWENLKLRANETQNFVASPEADDTLFERKRRASEDIYAGEGKLQKRGSKSSIDSLDSLKDVLPSDVLSFLNSEEVSETIISVLEEADTRTARIAKQETTEKDWDDHKRSGTSQGELPPLMCMRKIYREASQGKDEELGIIERVKQLKSSNKLLDPENYDPLQNDIHKLFNAEMDMLEKANVEGVDKQRKQWKEIKDCSDKLLEWERFGPEDRIACSVQYLKDYNGCLRSLYKTHEANKKENSEEVSEGERVKASQEKLIESRQVENHIKEINLKLEMMSLKREDLSAFNKIKNAQDKCEGLIRTIYDDFDKEVRYFATLTDQIYSREVRESYDSESERIVSKMKQSYVDDHSQFLRHMREAVTSTNDHRDYHLDLAINMAEIETYGYIQGFIDEIQGLTDKLYNEYPDLRPQPNKG